MAKHEGGPDKHTNRPVLDHVAAGEVRDVYKRQVQDLMELGAKFNGYRAQYIRMCRPMLAYV